MKANVTTAYCNRCGDWKEVVVVSEDFKKIYLCWECLKKIYLLSPEEY